MGDAGPQDDILTFDRLLRQRAIDADQSPLIAYPKSRQGVTDYELLTGATLHRLVDGAAKCLLELGFKPVASQVNIAGAFQEFGTNQSNSTRRKSSVSTHQVIWTT